MPDPFMPLTTNAPATAGVGHQTRRVVAHHGAGSSIMLEVLSANLWRRLRALSENAQIRMAAVAYVTDAQTLSFGAGDLLVTDASDARIQGGQTNAQALVDLHGRGVELWSSSNLHAKVYVFDSIAVVGSANLSRSSREVLTEAAMLSNDPVVVESAISLIRSIATKSVAVDAVFLERILKIPVEAAVSSRGNSSNSLPPGEQQGMQIPEAALTEPELIESDVFEASLKSSNRIRMAALWLVQAFSEIEEVNNNSRFVPGYVANIIWTRSGRTVKTNIPEQPLFSSPNEVYIRAARISKKHEKRIIALLRYIVDSDATPPNVSYWAKKSLER